MNVTSNNCPSSTSSTASILPSPQQLMHINHNNPPIYDPRYLYLIDCRPNKKKFERAHIQTAVHYSDVLSDAVYLSPPVDNFTLIVLYDDDGTFLTSSSSSSSSTASWQTNNGKTGDFRKAQYLLVERLL